MEHFETSTILLVTADAGRAAYLTDQLEADGFDVVVAEDGAMGVRALARSYPDLVVVDARLPDGPATRVLAAIRSADDEGTRIDPETPAVVMVDGDDPFERVRALDRGADDAVAAPPHYPEFAARIRALLRRVQGRAKRSMLRVGPLEVDPMSRRVRIGERPVELSQKEFALLEALAAEPTRVFSKEELLRAVWGYRSGDRTRTLDSHACRLRRKLRADGVRFVINVWGVGYRLVDVPAPAEAQVAVEAARGTGLADLPLAA